MFALNTESCLGMAAAVMWASASIAQHRSTRKARVT
jgi:hypothetical protein